MEKIIKNKFYLLSCLNLIPVVILGKGLTLDTLALFGSLVVLVVNHTILVKIVQTVTTAASGGSEQGVGKILGLMALKFLMLFSLVALIYFYNKDLVLKLFLIIFFQLIIQVISIKNNYQNS